MKNKQRIFFGFTIVLFMVIISIVGCDLFDNPEFPSEFIGTWIREDSIYSNTLTITATTYKLSNKPETWELVKISGDTYFIKSRINNIDHDGKEVINYVNGKLEIAKCGDIGEGNCGGTWTKK